MVQRSITRTLCPSDPNIRASNSSHLEDQLMRELALAEAERRLEVFCEVVNLGDGSDDGLVELLLVSRLGLWEGLLLLGFALREELLLSRLLRLGRRLPEVGVIDLLVDLYK